MVSLTREILLNSIIPDDLQVFVALISPEYSNNDQCKMEYQFALQSLKKPVLPVIISPGKISQTIGQLGRHTRDEENKKNKFISWDRK